MIQFQTVCTLCMVFSIHAFTIQHHERDVNMINMILKRTRSKKLAIGPIGPIGPMGPCQSLDSWDCLGITLSINTDKAPGKCGRWLAEASRKHKASLSRH